MNAKRNDISQIRKYLNEELDATAMNRLEREALDDPFLMDAMHGYENSQKDQQLNLNDLQSHLQRRITSQPERVMLWPSIAAAASVLLFIAIGGWWFLGRQALVPTTEVIVKDKTAVKPQASSPANKQLRESLPEQDMAVLKPAGEHNDILKQTPQKVGKAPVNPAESANTALGAVPAVLAPMDTALLASADPQKIVKIDEPVGNAPLSKDVITTSGYLAAKETQEKKAKSPKTRTPDTLIRALTGRVEGAMVYDDNPTARKRTVDGLVLSQSGLEPLAGASVRVSGRSDAVQTDINGHFSINATDKDELKIAYLGFDSKQVSVKGRDSLKVILGENRSALNEVVVVGYGAAKRHKRKAEPSVGWEKFRSYLAAPVSPDGKEGTVQLSFVVNADNSLSDFKVLKSVSKETDDKAIGLIINGPRWVHNSQGKPETVKLKISFKKR